MILAPQEINPRISDEELRSALRDYAKRVNVVVLVPSFRRATEWDGIADLTAAAEDIGDAVERLRQGHVGLVVLVNKYDGIDLPNDACRILVVDGLPEAYGGIERREAVALGETEAMVGRQLQRVEQGMGRGVRSADDYCVVILLGSRLSQLIAQPTNARKLGPATRAQLHLSRQLAAQLEGQDISELLGVIGQALDRDQAWVVASREALAGLSYEAAGVTPMAKSSRHAFNAASTGQYAIATREMSEAVNAAQEARLKGWLQEQLAVYEHHVDPPRAQQALAGAVRHNPRVTRPIEGVTYRRLAATQDQARLAASYLASRYPDRNSLLVGTNAVIDALVFHPDETDAFEDAFETAGRLIGFPTQRPERDTGTGPDVLWAIGESRYLVIECKSGSTANRIWRRDVAQLAHSMNWFRSKYDRPSSATPLLVHPVARLESNAVAAPETRVMTKSHVQAFREALRAVAVALANQATWENSEHVGSQLSQQRLTGPDFLTAFTTTPRAM
ncbi:MAG: helicase C-terminal domain-containing protein [Actinomycetota bacterium]